MSGWWRGITATQATISCGEAQHRLRWADGELQALDHDDADAERTLAALGGQRCACVELLDAWARHTGDLRVLTLASRGPSDRIHPATDTGPPIPPLRAPGRNRARPGAGPGIAAAAARRRGPSGAPDPDGELLQLLALEGGLPDRLVATTLAVWAEHVDRQTPEAVKARAQLHAALHGRATAALRTWLSQPGLAVSTSMINSADEARLSASDSGLQADLPLSWLANVWSKGLAVVSGRFCLNATMSGDGWSLTTVAPELGPPQPITIELSSS
jgi:hypothetical protein